MFFAQRLSIFKEKLPICCNVFSILRGEVCDFELPIAEVKSFQNDVTLFMANPNSKCAISWFSHTLLRISMSASLARFRAFAKRTEDGKWDMSGLVSRECYVAWLESKGATECDLEAAKFKRCLGNHVSGTDRRVPFDLEEEEALLILLRKKAPWPCFPKHLQYLGQRYRAMGYHEKLRTSTALVAAEQAAVVREEDDCENIVIHPLLTPLDMADALYLTRLVEYIVGTDQHHRHPQVIHEVLRYMILGRTDCCSKPVPPMDYAQALCDQFLAANTAVMVLDMTSSSTFKDCALCQNELISGWRCEAMFENDLVQSVLAIGAAYHLPGICFSTTAQQISCGRRNEEEEEGFKLFDMNYYVDSESFFLVVFGKEVSQV